MVNHEAAIEHINKQLAEHGIVSFAKINKIAEGKFLNKTVLAKEGNPTAKHVKALLDLGNHILFPLPVITKTRTRKGSKNIPMFIYHLIESDLEPFLHYAQASAGMGLGAYHPLVNTLFKIDEQNHEDNHVLLPSGYKGTFELLRIGSLEKVRFKSGERPKELDTNIQRFKITDPALMKRAINVVRRAIEIQETRYD